MDAANKACQPIMEKAAGSFDPPSPEEQEKAKEQALAFAKCMREHGIDMPDPQFTDNGGINLALERGGLRGTRRRCCWRILVACAALRRRRRESAARRGPEW